MEQAGYDIAEPAADVQTAQLINSMSHDFDALPATAVPGLQSKFLVKHSEIWHMPVGPNKPPGNDKTKTLSSYLASVFP